MGRIESALDRILEHLQLPRLNEGGEQPVASNESDGSISIPDRNLNSKTIPGNPNAPQAPEFQTPKVFPGSYTYTALDETKSQIRVLKLYRAKNFGDPLVLDVQIQNLDDDMLSNPFSRYTALSYCWGPPIMDASIILAGHHFPITKSLESALRHLRNVETGYGPLDLTTGKKGDYELWWIDQISINQADIDERGSQVSLMRQIYKRAGSVQVWLGDEADDSSTAFDVLNRVAAPPVHAPGEKPIHYPTFTDADVAKHWKALDALFKRQWWERVWIRQEISLNYTVKLWCGEKSCDLNILGPALYVLGYFRSFAKRSLGADLDCNETTAVLPWNHHPEKLVELSKSTAGGYTWVELSRLLLNARGCKATDPCDAVFSVLGLANPEVYSIAPDYRQDLHEIFIAAARKAIPHDEYGLNILSACQNPEMRHGLPS